MPTYHIPYGHNALTINLPFTADVVQPPRVPEIVDEIGAVQAAITSPVGGISLQSLRSAKTAAITVNDKTRPSPNHLFLPPLIENLEKIGVTSDNITLFVATGSHAPATQEDFAQLIPADIRAKVNIVSHDCDDQSALIPLGITSRGTKVVLNRAFLSADIRIVTGEIEPHHFMGFSGGVKSACIGLAGRSTINQNHAMLVDENAVMGEYERNPMRMDLEEMGDIAKVHFALNAILTPNKKLAAVLFGPPREVMRAGVEASRAVYEVRFSGLYDLVITSPGGHPRDINLYQAQKAFSHAARFCKPGGIILLAAACPEGSGNAKFDSFISTTGSIGEIITKFQNIGFEIGPHKAYQLARQAQKYQLWLVSDFSQHQLPAFLCKHAKSLSAALAEILPVLPTFPRIAILPHATHVIPQIDGGQNE